MKNIKKLILCLIWLNIHFNLSNGELNKTNSATVGPLLQPITKELSSEGCRISYIPNLIIESDNMNPKEISPGDNVLVSENVTYNCNHGYALNGVTHNYCIGSEWSHPVPTCIKYCSIRFLYSITTEIICERNGITVDCNLPILPGTRANIACAFGYSKPLFGIDKINCEPDGAWDYAQSRCQQDCGKVNSHLSSSFIIGGAKTNDIKMPWHVAIYSSRRIPNEYICGGTIVSAKIVISAAHCFWNLTNNKINDIKYYKVGAGKYYRAYDAIEPLETQFSDIANIDIPSNYKDIQLNFISDIAVIVLEKYLKFTYYIQPACLLWMEYSEQAIKSNLVGHIAIWSKTATNDEIMSELNAIQLSTLSYQDCVAQTNKELQNLITGDKFCVGSENGTTSIVQGDGGSGFGITINEKGVEQFVLQGIVSSNVNLQNHNFSTIVTNIQYFKQMIESYMNKYKVQ